MVDPVDAFDWEELAQSLEHDSMLSAALERENLRDFRAKVEGELEEVEAASVEEYLAQSPTVASLHVRMRLCDEGLSQIQSVLTDFDRRLAGTAAEVAKKRRDCERLAVRVSNRVAAEGRLAGYLRRLVLPTDAEVAIESLDPLSENERFAAYVALVDSRLDEFGRDAGLSNSRSLVKHRGMAMSPAETAAGDDCVQRLEALKDRACARIRESLLLAVADLRTAGNVFANESQSTKKPVVTVQVVSSAGGVPSKSPTTTGGHQLLVRKPKPPGGGVVAPPSETGTKKTDDKALKKEEEEEVSVVAQKNTKAATATTAVPVKEATTTTEKRAAPARFFSFLKDLGKDHSATTTKILLPEASASSEQQSSQQPSTTKQQQPSTTTTTTKQQQMLQRQYQLEQLRRRRQAQEVEMRGSKAAAVVGQFSLATVGGPLMRFLEKRAPSSASEVRSAYVEAASRTFRSIFKAYADPLARAELPVANRFDLVAVDESAVRNVVTSKVSFAKRGDAFAMGDRNSVLIDCDAPVLDVADLFVIVEASSASLSPAVVLDPPTVTTSKKYPLEILFKSWLKRCRDLATCEAFVVYRLFDEGEAKSIFDACFQKLFQAFADLVDSKVRASHDVIGVMLVARLLRTAKERDASAVVVRDTASPQSPSKLLDFLKVIYDALETIVWPKLHHLIALNVDSAKKAATFNPDAAAHGGDAVVSNNFPLAPHHVSRRFAEIAAATVELFPPPPPQQPSEKKKENNTSSSSSRTTTTSLLEMPLEEEKKGPPLPCQSKAAAEREAADAAREKNEADLRAAVTGPLRDEVLGVLARLAAANFADRHKERVVFLANNYDQILASLRKVTTKHPMIAYFEALLARQRDAYVDATLDEGVGRLVAFVKTTEADAARLDKGRSLDLDSDLVESLVRDFATAWEPFLKKVNDDVLAHFANFYNGTEILKLTFTQLLLHYTRFQDIVRKAWRRPPPFAKDLVSTAAILVEIKKYTRTFS